MADRTLAQIIAALETDVYGKDMRADIVDLANKLDDIVTDAIDHQLITVDATLTQSGQGADAAVTGDKMIAYKEIDPADYSNKFANVNTSCLTTKNSNFTDMPGGGEYVLLNARYSYNYNVQFALGYAASDKNFYWRIVNRNDHAIYVDWTTDNTVIDTSLAVSGAAADAAVVGAALERINSDASISNSLSVGADHNTLYIGAQSARIGYGNTASDARSVAVGYNTIARNPDQFAEGRYNISDNGGIYAHIIGNGTASNARSNAATIDWDGNVWVKGTVKVGGTDMYDGSALATENYVDTAIGNAISSAIGGSY